ncbi:MAG: hypothetical protein WA906_06475, partial [Pacificimonas sp.]
MTVRSENDTISIASLPAVTKHPLLWLPPMLNGVKHANVFEVRSAEYSRAGTKGHGNDFWSSF